MGASSSKSGEGFPAISEEIDTSFLEQLDPELRRQLEEYDKAKTLKIEELRDKLTSFDEERGNRFCLRKVRTSQKLICSRNRT